MFHRDITSLIVSILSVICILSAGCNNKGSDVAQPARVIRHDARELPEKLSALDSQLIKLGLVDLKVVAPDVVVDLKYSTADNFTGIDLYGRMKRCYLQPEVVDMVERAQVVLDSMHPGYHLKVFDGARPMSVQMMMWDFVKDSEGPKYVAFPGYGSLHNFGAAVDVSIADSSGIELDMGTPFDSFDSLAQPRHEMYFYERGQLTEEQLHNRLLLRAVMRQAGFSGILKEWWHFNAMPVEEARLKYKLIE